jgi:hypothetical protein
MATNTEQMKDGMGKVLDGCATCCEGVRREAEAAGLAPEIMRDLDQAIRICREVATQIRS